MVTLGVTGGLGSGKTTACKFLAAKGAYVFDADLVAKQILETDTEVQRAISETFGIDIFKDGKIDTAKIARVAFVNEINQRQLNDIIHPRVMDAFHQLLKELGDQYPLVVVDAPLIFESGFDNHLDHTLLIYTKYRIRLERAIRRGNLTREDILRRMELQMPDEEKRELASFVIENNGTEEELRQAVEKLYHQLTT